MRITVGMSAYNCLEYSKLTLKSLSLAKDIPFHLVVVNDGSSDDSDAYFNKVLSNSENITYINHEKNLGAPKSWNEIIKQAQKVGWDDIIFIANNDIWLGYDTLSRLTQFSIDHPEAGVVSSHVIDGLYNFEDIDKEHDKWLEWTKNYYKQNGDKIDIGAHFCFFGCTKKCIDKVGLFDENFIKTSYEDCDMCLRCEYEELKVLTTYNAVIGHKGGVTQGYITQHSGNEFQRLNRKYFEEKHGVWLDGSICSRSIFWDKEDATNWKRRIPVPNL